jgi:hypothetical protein
LATLLAVGCETEEGTADAGEDDGGDRAEVDGGSDVGDGDGSACELRLSTVPDHGDAAAAAALAGTWGQLHVVSYMSNFPGYDAVASVVQMWQLVTATADANGRLTLTETYCRLLSDMPELAVDTIIPDAFVASLPPTVRHVAPAGAAPGSAFVSDTMVEVRGAVFDDSSCAPLPYAADDPRVVDQDGDGKAGMTLHFTGLVNVEVQVVQRWSSTFIDGVIESAARITGTVFAESQQQIVDASNGIFNPADPDPESLGSWPDPAREHSYFELVRLPAGAGCADVLALGLTPRPL